MATPEIETAFAQLNRTLGFFQSVIKSGEPWTDQCQQAYRDACTSLVRIKVAVDLQEAASK